MLFIKATIYMASFRLTRFSRGTRTPVEIPRVFWPPDASTPGYVIYPHHLLLASPCEIKMWSAARVLSYTNSSLSWLYRVLGRCDRASFRHQMGLGGAVVFAMFG